MEERIASSGRYFLTGLTVGWLLGIIFAPISGEGTREYLSRKIKERNKQAWKKARKLRELAEDLIDRRKEMVNQEKNQFAGEMDKTGTAPLPKMSKAKGA